LFNYPWNHVTHANWNKYPNPNSPQVIHVDVLDRRVDPETGILHTERLIACKQPIPTWISKVQIMGVFFIFGFFPIFSLIMYYLFVFFPA
jgi:hypothetical protein